MENNWLHKSGTNITWYNVSIQGFTLLSQIYIWTCPVCFAVKKCPLASLIYLSVSTNDPGIKSKIIGVMWQVAPESKIQLFSCELSPKFILGLSALLDIRAIDVYIFCDSISYALFPYVLYIFVDLYAQVLGFFMFQWTLLSKLSSSGNCVLKWSPDPHLKHVFLTVTFITLIIRVAWIKG